MTRSNPRKLIYYLIPSHLWSQIHLFAKRLQLLIQKLEQMKEWCINRTLEEKIVELEGVFDIGHEHGSHKAKHPCLCEASPWGTLLGLGSGSWAGYVFFRVHVAILLDMVDNVMRLMGYIKLLIECFRATYLDKRMCFVPIFFHLCSGLGACRQCRGYHSKKRMGLQWTKNKAEDGGYFYQRN